MQVNHSFDEHAHWMRHALQLARQAAAAGEVPVGAVVVKEGQVVGEGYNRPITGQDPTAHAEVLALRSAAHKLGNYRLEGCSLYVTLEPCTMCSGALLHARVDTVVYGAAEPKTGAAGSVLDVFAHAQINHRTQVVRGVLAEECAAVMAEFFQQRRTHNKALARANHPLKDTALRHPDAKFANLHAWPYVPQWRSDWPALQGLRMAIVDEGPKDAQQTWLCLHGAASWGVAFSHAVPDLLKAGHRVVVPDLPGFGRSDQPKRDKAHTVAGYIQVVSELVQQLDLQQVVLWGHGDGARLGLAVAQQMPQRFQGAWCMDAWPEAQYPKPWVQWLQTAAKQPQWDVAAQMAWAHGPVNQADISQALGLPFSQPGHRAALKAWPQLLAQWPPLPQALLQQWWAQRRLLLTRHAASRVLPESAWIQAWCAALANVPQMQQGCSGLTPMPAVVPAQEGSLVQQAMEYFAPTSKA